MPTTLNLKFKRVPGAVGGVPGKAPMIRWPGLASWEFIDMAELSVPAESNAGDAGVTTDGSKVIWRSYANTPWPVRLPTVIGTTITPPGVGVTLGSETTIPVREDAGPDVTRRASDEL